MWHPLTPETSERDRASSAKQESCEQELIKLFRCFNYTPRESRDLRLKEEAGESKLSDKTYQTSYLLRRSDRTLSRIGEKCWRVWSEIN